MKEENDEAHSILRTTESKVQNNVLLFSLCFDSLEELDNFRTSKTLIFYESYAEKDLIYKSHTSFSKEEVSKNLQCRCFFSSETSSLAIIARIFLKTLTSVSFDIFVRLFG